MFVAAALDLGDYLLGDAEIAGFLGCLRIVALAAARPVASGILQFPAFVFVTAAM
jgi:hypothetical protein